MNINSMKQILLAAGMTAGLGCAVAFAQDAKQDMKQAGHATKDAAVDTGHATKDAAVDVEHGTKKAYSKTKRGTKKVGHKTADGARTATHRTENAGDVLVGKPQEH